MQEIIDEMKDIWNQIGPDVLHSDNVFDNAEAVDAGTIRDIVGDKMWQCDDEVIRDLWTNGNYHEKQELLKEAFPDGGKY